MENQETDTALILENELKRRVAEVLGTVVHKVVREKMREVFTEQKASMMLEISIAVGKMLRVVEEEKRNPLWESDHKEFGLEKEELNTHMIEKVVATSPNMEK